MSWSLLPVQQVTATTVEVIDCNYPDWDATIAYPSPNTKVVYDGKLWRNKWYANIGEEPGANTWGAWEELGTCDDGNLAPEVSFISPANNATFELETTSSITINVAASDADGTVSSVSIEVDGQSFSGTSATWTPTAAGDYTISATATDDQGKSTTASIAITVTSTAPVAPVVSIDSPVDGETIRMESLSAVTINISASDEDGMISSTSIEVDGQSFNGTTASWVPSAFGTYTIVANATDSDGLTATSSVSVTIAEQNNGLCNYLPYEGYPTVYQTGDIVEYNGDTYEAQVDNLYNIEPGTADHWWKPLGPCVDTNNAPEITVADQESIGLIAVSLNAAVVDADGTVDAVSFEVDGTTLSGVATGDNYAASWTPASYGAFTVTVTATDEDNASSTATYTLTVSEPEGPQAPVITAISPANGSNIKQSSLAPVAITVSASDIDGTIVSTSITVDGQTFNQASASWTPSTFGAYSIVVTVTDNDGLSTTETVSVTVTENTAFTDKVLVGYWHNWNNASAPYIRLRDINPAYNVVCIAFAEPKVRDVDNTMIFDPMDLDAFQYQPTDKSRQEFKEDVAYLQSQGKKVLISLGGANGVVHLDNDTEKQKFTASMIDLIETYGFDGVDIDLEGSSLTLDAGDDDFKNPKTPRIVNFIDGIRGILDHFNGSLILTAAPETAYVQGGAISYGGSWGGYLPILYAFHQDFNYVHVQLYNTGSLLALDGQAYSQASPDFIVAMTEMTLQGFESKSVAGFFPAFRDDQIALGLPSTPPAAPAGGYVTPAEVHKALDYLTKGISFGGDYVMVNPNGYPNLRGMMTWSINWDKTVNYEYANSYTSYFGGASARFAELEVAKAEGVKVYPNPFSNYINIELPSTATKGVFAIYDINGKQVYCGGMEKVNAKLRGSINTENLESGLYFLSIQTSEEVVTKRLLKQ
ncbi:Ig-like domain-containing protein [Algivirga pacifica]|uniref:chitinase n=2 Tax=Algivirga pacifica TaxID=1162670 RepID=A0ABP9DMY5_9BACT